MSPAMRISPFVLWHFVQLPGAKVYSVLLSVFLFSVLHI